EGFAFCHPKESSDFETIQNLLDGTPRSSDWRPLEMDIVLTDQGKTLRRSDSPWLGAHALVFTDRAARVLAPLLGGVGEFLRCNSSKGPVYLFNPTSVVDSLDEESSVV